MNIHSQKRSSRGPWRILLALMLVTIVVLATLRTGAPPQLDLTTDLPGIGPKTVVTAQADEPGRGLSSLRLTLMQGDVEEILLDEEFTPRPFWAFWGERTTTLTRQVEVGSEIQPSLVDGTATLRWTAGRAGTWLRHPDAVNFEMELPVRLSPPTLQVTSERVTIDQGGAAVVTYRVGEHTVRDGVQINGHFFPGSSLPGGDATERFALFGAPYDGDPEDGDPEDGDPDDLENAEAFRLLATDELGNQRSIPVVDTFRPRAMTRDDIQLSVGFMTKVSTEILAQTPELKDLGDPLTNYLHLNGELRKVNSATLVELGTQSVEEFLWHGAFKQLPNSRVMAPFADRRTYKFDGQDVDQQDHLGFDLASVRRAPVPAANGGRIVLARYFGIYGTTVVIDHGYGLMSLYSHLSSLEVSEGQIVAQGDIVARTGETGLAGGDHLHFSMLLRGMQVNPLEWWDRRWIKNRIMEPLREAGLKAQDASTQ